MTQGVDIEGYLRINLVGSIDQVIDKVDAYRSAGLDHLTALLFVGNTVDELRHQMRAFARHVLPLFPEPELGRILRTP
jgi:hypothetical protein